MARRVISTFDLKVSNRKFLMQNRWVQAIELPLWPIVALWSFFRWLRMTLAETWSHFVKRRLVILSAIIFNMAICKLLTSNIEYAILWHIDCQCELLHTIFVASMNWSLMLKNIISRILVDERATNWNSTSFDMLRHVSICLDMPPHASICLDIASNRHCSTKVDQQTDVSIMVRLQLDFLSIWSHSNGVVSPGKCRDEHRDRSLMKLHRLCSRESVVQTVPHTLWHTPYGSVAYCLLKRSMTIDHRCH